MRNTKTMLVAVVAFLLTTTSLLADNPAKQAPTISPGADPRPNGQYEVITPQADNGITRETGGRNWGENMPASAIGQRGAGVGYPGYRGQGVSGNPQHEQYANPPPQPATDPVTTSSHVESNAATNAKHRPSPEPKATNTDPRKIKTDRRRALLHAAAFGDLLTLDVLLKEGASANARAKGSAGRTALMLAAAGGHVDIVEALLKKGARVDDRDKAGFTALNWAAMRGQVQVVITLLKNGADINTRTNNGISPVLYAVGIRNTTLLKLLVNKNADLEAESRENKMTPLLLAIEYGDIESVNLLLEKGAGVNRSNSDHFSPLMAAAEKGQTELVQMLIARGAELNARDNKGLTALLYAADKQHTETMQLLLARGADVNARELYKRTALLRAVAAAKQDAVKVIQESGAEINAENQQ